jgi:hypothetical protein
VVARVPGIAFSKIARAWVPGFVMLGALFAVGPILNQSTVPLNINSSLNRGLCPSPYSRSVQGKRIYISNTFCITKMLLVNDLTLKISAVNSAHGVSSLWLQFVSVLGSHSPMNSFIKYVAVELGLGHPGMSTPTSVYDCPHAMYKVGPVLSMSASFCFFLGL